MTQEQRSIGLLLSRALDTYICELESVRDGESNNIRYTPGELKNAKALEKKFNSGHYYVVRDY